VTIGLPGESTASRVRSKSRRIVPIGSTGGRPATNVGNATATSAITSLAPNTGAHTVQKSGLVVNGTGFKPGCGIYVAGKAIVTQYVSATQVRTGSFVPGPAGTVAITVRNPGEAASAASNFTVT